MSTLKRHNLTTFEAVFSLLLIGVGLSLISGFLSTFQSIPREAFYELVGSVTLVATGFGYILKKSWTRYTYLLVIALAAIFFGSALTSGFSLSYYALSYFIRVIPLVLTLIFWKHVTARVAH